MPLKRHAGCSLPLLLAALQLVLCSSYAVAQRVRVCGTPEMSFSAAQTIQQQLNATMEALVGTTNQTLAGQRLAASAAGMESANARTAAAKPATGISVKVYFHVLRTGTAASQGNVPDAQIAKQMQVLNTMYAQTGAVFTLAGTTRTTNAAWYTSEQGSPDWVAMTNALHQGGVQDLNLYSMSLLYPLLGFSSFPWWYGTSPKQDGVFFDLRSMPGGSADSFNLGMTVVHEVGHWFGLFHPFQGGCSSPNDYVADTAAQAQPETQCVSAPRDTCPSLPGTDVFRNILDYPPDACMDRFTTGQATRMAVSWNAYRVPGARAYAPGGAPVPANVAASPTTPAPTPVVTKPAPSPTPRKVPTTKPKAPTPKPKTPTKPRSLPKACGGKCGKPKPTVRKLPAACGGKCGKPKVPTPKPKTGRKRLQ